MNKTFLLFLLWISSHALGLNINDQRPEEINDQMWASLQTAYNETRLGPNPNGLGQRNGHYGSAVSVDGNRAVIGSSGLLDLGALIVLEYTGSEWQQTAVLKNPSSFDYVNPPLGYGSAVSLSGDRIAAGVYGDGEAGENAGAVFIYDWNGVEWVETKIMASDASSEQYFGSSVSLSGNRVVVGAPYDDQKGAVYFYDWNGVAWIETKLTASDGEFFAEFGGFVSHDNDRIVVGSPYSDSTSGAAYIYEWNGASWTETKIMPSDSAIGQNFGSYVSIEGDTAAIGANYDDENGTAAGAAYLYQWDNNVWIETKLTASDGAQNDVFGKIEINNNQVIISAKNDDDNGSNSGSVYVYDWDGNDWIESKITASDGAASDFFGSSISISNEFLFVGAPDDDEGLINSGSVYIYNWTGVNWQEVKLFLSPGSAEDYFGYSVSHSNNRVMVGAPNDIENDIQSGSVYIFEWDGQQWNGSKIIPTDAEDFANFGHAVSLDGDRAVVGAPFDSGSAPYAGAVYIYDWDGNSWIESKLAASDIASDDAFGKSVALTGDRMVVGSDGDGDNGSSSGAVYIYDLIENNWLETKLIATDGEANDRFASSVSFHMDSILVGAPYHANSGAAYFYQWDGLDWVETKILPITSNTYSEFGSAVSIDNNRLLIGEPFVFDNGNYYGNAYIFDWDGQSWSETKLSPSSHSNYDLFGKSVSLKGDNALIGSPGGIGNGNNSGAAYLFNFDSSSWNETLILPNTDHESGSFGSSVSFSNNSLVVGDPDAAENLGSTGLAYIFQGPDLIFSNGFEAD